MSLVGRMLSLGTILVLGACNGSPLAPRTYTEDEIRLTISPPDLTIANVSDQRVVYVIMTTDVAAAWLLNLRGWPSIGPGGTVSLEYSEIPGYAEGKDQEILIQWAPVTGSQDGPADATSIKHMRAPL